MTFEDLIDLFYLALAAHETEAEAYSDVEYVMDQALLNGFTVAEAVNAYGEAYRG